MRTSLALGVTLLVLVNCGQVAPDVRAAAPPPAEAGTPQPVADLDVRIVDLTAQLAEAQAARAAALRQAEEAERRTWRRWARILVAATIVLSVAAAGLGLWLGFARLAVPLAAIATACALAVQCWAEAQAYAAWLLPALGVGGLVVGAVVLIRHRRAIAATASLADALETGGIAKVPKAEARAAIIAAGLHRFVQDARGKQV